MKAMMIFFSLCLCLLIGCGENSSSDTAQETTTPVPTSPLVTIPTEDIPKITWKELENVSFENKFYDDIQAWMLFPTFGDTVKALAGKPVVISGYVLTLEPGLYALSANPFSSCFFCGGAGPESVLLLELSDPDELFFTDEWKTFRGVFELNDSDVDKLNYVLTFAEEVEEE